MKPICRKQCESFLIQRQLIWSFQTRQTLFKLKALSAWRVMLLRGSSKFHFSSPPSAEDCCFIKTTRIHGSSTAVEGSQCFQKGARPVCWWQCVSALQCKAPPQRQTRQRQQLGFGYLRLCQALYLPPGSRTWPIHGTSCGPRNSKLQETKERENGEKREKGEIWK